MTEIRFTKQQYEDLVKMVYLGTWMVNGIRTADDAVEKYEKLEQYILSFANDFDFGKFVEYDAKSKKYFPNADFEQDEELERYRDEYDDDCFWDSLVDRLARRDFIKTYGEDAIKRMDREERFLKEEPFIKKYTNEVCDNGIDRISLQENTV